LCTVACPMWPLPSRQTLWGSRPESYRRLARAWRQLPSRSHGGSAHTICSRTCQVQQPCGKRRPSHNNHHRPAHVSSKCLKIMENVLSVSAVPLGNKCQTWGLCSPSWPCPLAGLPPKAWHTNEKHAILMSNAMGCCTSTPTPATSLALQGGRLQDSKARAQHRGPSTKHAAQRQP